MGEGPSQLCVQAVSEPREKTASACENDVAHEDLAELGIACAESFADECWYVFREVRVRGLETGIGCATGLKVKYAGDLRLAVVNARRTARRRRTVQGRRRCCSQLGTHTVAVAAQQRLFGQGHDQTPGRQEWDSQRINPRIVPALLKYAAHTLCPLVHFFAFRPCSPAVCGTCKAVLAGCKPRGCTWVCRLRGSSGVLWL